jgi:hypothetical protein
MSGSNFEVIDLNSFLEAVGIKLLIKKTKVHLACWNGREHPIDEYYAGRFKEWQEDQGRANFSCDYILSLIDIGNKNWLFAGIYQVTGCQAISGGFKYSTKLLTKQENLIGRLIIYHKRSRASYIWWKDDLVFPIIEIRREKLSIGDFPGYNSVDLSYNKLKIIIDEKVPSWNGALANIKGVYLITDTTSGKHYVGKASGEVGIWQRWSSYVKNGHGGNDELKKLLKAKGTEHRINFKYSILEIADTHASDLYILERESYWMNVLMSRKFGLN